MATNKLLEGGVGRIIKDVGVLVINSQKKISRKILTVRKGYPKIHIHNKKWPCPSYDEIVEGKSRKEENN